VSVKPERRHRHALLAEPDRTWFCSAKAAKSPLNDEARDSESPCQRRNPVHNGEPYLRECIESVLAQTYPHWAQTIVNNCSTDLTFEIAREYAAKDPPIRSGTARPSSASNRTTTTLSVRSRPQAKRQRVELAFLVESCQYLSCAADLDQFARAEIQGLV
jgi:hypothetical protein